MRALFGDTVDRHEQRNSGILLLRLHGLCYPFIPACFTSELKFNV